MKKITALLGFLGVVSMFSACAEDTISEPPMADNHTSVGTSSAAGSVQPSAKSSASATPSSNSGTRDTTVVHETVYIQQENVSYEVPYYSSGTFCWSAECDATANSAASSAPTSAATIEINMSSTIPTPPLVSGNQMIDQRDQKSYKIKTIAGKMWMEENINYKTSKGYYCTTTSGDDMCATYGGYYTYAAALSACPDGWRLPTEAEVKALDAAVAHDWWQVGGRFKLETDTPDYGLKEEQGYIWIQPDGDYTSFRVKNYGGEDNLHEFQTGTTGERAYNVRCVQN